MSHAYLVSGTKFNLVGTTMRSFFDTLFYFFQYMRKKKQPKNYRKTVKARFYSNQIWFFRSNSVNNGYQIF